MWIFCVPSSLTKKQESSSKQQLLYDNLFMEKRWDCDFIIIIT